MAPIPSLLRCRLLYALCPIISTCLSRLRILQANQSNLSRRDDSSLPNYEKILYPILIVMLVLLSGLFAGLTLGYMSLDQTQLNVLSVSGTPEQRIYANKIKPIRENGHLLLVSLLLANMIVNETLPIIADPVLGGGVESVVVSTVLIVIFSEIIPQSLFTRHGLFLGAKCVGFTRCLIWGLGIVSWPVAKLLDWIVGSNHGIIYRRVELKELISMHSSSSPHGGDLTADTIAIIGATLDLQEKIVSQAMTPLANVFMLSIDDKLDLDLLKKIIETGHSRIPVYEEVDAPLGMKTGGAGVNTQKVQRMLGVLLVKQLVLLDPKDAVPIRNLQLNKVPFIPWNETLLGILDKFQEGRSHMAIVSRFSAEKAKSVRKVVKQSLINRLKERVGIDSDDSDTSDTEHDENFNATNVKSDRNPEHSNDYQDDGSQSDRRRTQETTTEGNVIEMGGLKSAVNKMGVGISSLEASFPADAVLLMDGANELGINMPLGIITLEDVLEELIGEEIYDEFDVEGAHGEPYLHPPSVPVIPAVAVPEFTKGPISKSLSNVKSLSFFQSRKPPAAQRDKKGKETPHDSTATGNEEFKRTDHSNDVALAQAPGVAAKVDHSSSGPRQNPIEAVLLDRRRRLTAASSWAAGSSDINRRGPNSKGNFKSSPIKKSRSNPLGLTGNYTSLVAVPSIPMQPGTPREEETQIEGDSAALDLTLVRTLTDHSSEEPQFFLQPRVR